MEKLSILDEQGNIIGEEYRDVIHQKGLLHGEVHVWCLTTNNELIFQHRAKDKDIILTYLMLLLEVMLILEKLTRSLPLKNFWKKLDYLLLKTN